MSTHMLPNGDQATWTTRDEGERHTVTLSTRPQILGRVVRNNPADRVPAAARTMQVVCVHENGDEDSLGEYLLWLGKRTTGSDHAWKAEDMTGQLVAEHGFIELAAALAILRRH